MEELTFPVPRSFDIHVSCPSIFGGGSGEPLEMPSSFLGKLTQALNFQISVAISEEGPHVVGVTLVEAGRRRKPFS